MTDMSLSQNGQGDIRTPVKDPRGGRGPAWEEAGLLRSVVIDAYRPRPLIGVRSDSVGPGTHLPTSLRPHRSPTPLPAQHNPPVFLSLG